LIPHAGDTQPQPFELAEGGCDNAKIGTQVRLWLNDCSQNHGQQI